ncbi:DUF6192 family protein [Streptomyces canus]|uniref:DUF6192 family protein n=1 Tax=Streptomyces canus TaxID=58343 RepID=UPI003724A053
MTLGHGWRVVQERVGTGCTFGQDWDGSCGKRWVFRSLVVTVGWSADSASSCGPRLLRPVERRPFDPPGRAPCPRWAVGRARGRGSGGLVGGAGPVMTGCQFALGDIALDVAPLRSGKRDARGRTSSGWRVLTRVRRGDRALLPYRVHVAVGGRAVAGGPAAGGDVLRGAPDPGGGAGRVRAHQRSAGNGRTGRSKWSQPAAKRAAGWSTATPVTVEVKVEAIRDLAADETVAALAVPRALLTERHSSGD